MPRPLPSNVEEQIAQAYRQMAKFYRPAAPSDGLGNITVPVRSLDLKTECAEYAKSWWSQESDDTFFVGCPSMNDRPALIYIIEAARNLCGMGPEEAKKLLRMALSELEKEHPEPKRARPPRRS